MDETEKRDGRWKRWDGGEGSRAPPSLSLRKTHVRPVAVIEAFLPHPLRHRLRLVVQLEPPGAVEGQGALAGGQGGGRATRKVGQGLGRVVKGAQGDVGFGAVGGGVGVGCCVRACGEVGGPNVCVCVCVCVW